MNEEQMKICSQCGAEYALEAMVCADCGGALVFPGQYKERSIPVAEEEEAVLIRQGTADYLRELDALLKRSGIRTAIQFHGCEPGT
jgi:hypothetical protein